MFTKLAWDPNGAALKRQMENYLELATWWARYNDPYIAENIKQIGQVKLLAATKYMADVIDVETARKIMDICRNHKS